MRPWPKCLNAYLFSRNSTFVELESVKVEINQDLNKAQTYLLRETVQWEKPRAKRIKTGGSFYPCFSFANSQFRIAYGSNETKRYLEEELMRWYALFVHD